MEQDRASPLFLHLDGLARPAPDIRSDCDRPDTKPSLSVKCVLNFRDCPGQISGMEQSLDLNCPTRNHNWGFKTLHHHFFKIQNSDDDESTALFAASLIFRYVEEYEYSDIDSIGNITL